MEIHASSYANSVVTYITSNAVGEQVTASTRVMYMHRLDRDGIVTHSVLWADGAGIDSSLRLILSNDVVVGGDQVMSAETTKNEGPKHVHHGKNHGRTDGIEDAPTADY